MNENYVIDWLKSYFDKPLLDEKTLKPVLHFSLLWNLFEHTYFTDDSHLTPRRLLDISEVSYNKLSEEEVNSIYNFFKARYFSGNHLDTRFNHLVLDRIIRNGQPSNYDFCQSILTTDNPTNSDKTKAIFLIIHRFRNNLFHGRKNPETLNVYEQPFREINKFLVHFIEETADDDTINNKRQIQ